MYSSGAGGRSLVKIPALVCRVLLSSARMQPPPHPNRPRCAIFCLPCSPSSCLFCCISSFSFGSKLGAKGRYPSNAPFRTAVCSFFPSGVRMKPHPFQSQQRGPLPLHGSYCKEQVVLRQGRCATPCWSRATLEAGPPHRELCHFVLLEKGQVS